LAASTFTTLAEIKPALGTKRTCVGDIVADKYRWRKPADGNRLMALAESVRAK